MSGLKSADIINAINIVTEQTNEYCKRLWCCKLYWLYKQNSLEKILIKGKRKNINTGCSRTYSF